MYVRFKASGLFKAQTERVLLKLRILRKRSINNKNIKILANVAFKK
jgi:hypothetical protein